MEIIRQPQPCRTADGDHSLFALKFNIPSIKSDSLRWNKEWDKVLHTLSASEDVYPVR